MIKPLIVSDTNSKSIKIRKQVFKIFSKKKNFFKINILAANKNYSLICKQIIQYKPKIFIVNDEKVFLKVKDRFRKNKVKIVQKVDIKNRYFKKSDITVAAIPGIAGLKPTIELTKKSKKIFLKAI